MPKERRPLPQQHEKRGGVHERGKGTVLTPWRRKRPLERRVDEGICGKVAFGVSFEKKGREKVEVGGKEKAGLTSRKRGI